MGSELTPTWYSEIGSACEAAVVPISAAHSLAIGKPFPLGIASFVFMPPIRDLIRSSFNDVHLPTSRESAYRKYSKSFDSLHGFPSRLLGTLASALLTMAGGKKASRLPSDSNSPEERRRNHLVQPKLQLSTRLNLFSFGRGESVGLA
jgi:hypothetical protein